jgi:predicted adenylyl cyclase CyaB
MPANIEIKARVKDFYGLKKRAESLSDKPVQVISQEDTFFVIPEGRLKLRVLSADYAQLVWYARADDTGPKRSNYQIYETHDPDNLKTTLSLALGVRGVVRKVRYLYMAGQTRIHLDDVEGLGYFMELEVVMRKGQSDAEGQAIAEQLMEKLDIESGDLLDVAYMDMIDAAKGM